MELVLVGLPGSGKTEIGRRIAARLGATFVDTDHEVERGAGRSIGEVFERDGEASFRALERSAIKELGAADAGPSVGRVIATGPGAVR